MAAEEAFCRALRAAVGSEVFLVVAELSNGQEIRETTSIPTAATAMKRFEVAVLGAITTWVEGGPLSAMHVGMLVSEIPPDLEQTAQQSVERYSFIDTWSGAGEVQLEMTLAVVGLAGFLSLSDALKAAEAQLADLDDGRDRSVRRNLSANCIDSGNQPAVS